MREIDAGASRSPARRLGTAAAGLAAYAIVTAVAWGALHARRSAPEPERPARRVAVANGAFSVDGEPFVVLAVGWDPARPGELPWTRRFDGKAVEADFQRIRAAGFDAIRTWAPMTPQELDLAWRHGLRVLQGIWIPPDADFGDPAFRRKVLADVDAAVRASRDSPAILAYLVMNEPRARAVARAGLDETRGLLREVAATIRALDPGTPVGFANWPGTEALDDDLLDFVAFNLYPHRPRAAMDDLGIERYVRLLADSVARGRPLVVTEFGVSVSPIGTPEGRGGASPSEQAAGLVALDRSFFAAGVAGTSVFQWNDGWWKNADRPGDEMEHDPADPEEWFGLIQFSGPGDTLGTPRPALQALARFNRAVVVEPRAGAPAGPAVPIRVFAPTPVAVSARIAADPAPPVALRREGRNWLVGEIAVPPGPDTAELRIELDEPDGSPIRTETRVLARRPRTASLHVSPARQRVAPGAPFDVQLRLDAVPGPLRVTVAAYREDAPGDVRRVVTLSPGRPARVRLRAPSAETILSVLAFESGPNVSPEARLAALAAVEVRAP